MATKNQNAKISNLTLAKYQAMPVAAFILGTYLLYLHDEKGMSLFFLSFLTFPLLVVLITVGGTIKNNNLLKNYYIWLAVITFAYFVLPILLGLINT